MKVLLMRDEQKGDNWKLTLGNLNLGFVIQENEFENLSRASHPKTHSRQMHQYQFFIINHQPIPKQSWPYIGLQ